MPTKINQPMYDWSIAETRITRNSLGQTETDGTGLRNSINDETNYLRVKIWKGSRTRLASTNLKRLWCETETTLIWVVLYVYVKINMFAVA